MACRSWSLWAFCELSLTDRWFIFDLKILRLALTSPLNLIKDSFLADSYFESALHPQTFYPRAYFKEFATSASVFAFTGFLK